jgi:hypothetical protein
MTRATPRTAAVACRGCLGDALVLMALKLCIGAYVVHAGFSHVSDDDYARTVIAEQFAHAPRLDPSGTSWLPLPFWVLGTAMMALGRSLAVARSVAVVLGTAAVVLPYAALRLRGAGRLVAITATAVAMAMPWNAWLGVASVPEGWTGAAAGAAIIALAVPSTRWAVAGTLLATSLSRYETWPVCALAAALGLARAAREKRADDLACALLCAAGPLLWIAWNAHAHGDALHFLVRVSAFRRAAGAAARPLKDKIFEYPAALVTGTPEAAFLGALGLGAMFATKPVRKRWFWSTIAVLATFAFLIAGDIRDGAPTHHPERALSSTWWVFVAMGVDAIATAFATLPVGTARVGFGALGASALAWGATLPFRFRDAPGMAEFERRDAQIARGLDMRQEHVASAVVTPCAFEHFALIAAWGRPERARIAPSLHRPPTTGCPEVEASSMSEPGLAP